ncbi:MAG TPA: AAA family ATPase [Candidatus Kapabacteria bacterium]|nr:AAA family ATPase [Candidatus Kapabacteria bacterium]
MTARIRDFITRGAMPLVGRDRELRTLLDAFASLLEGEARAVWLMGVPGAGKSRLLDELKSHAREGSSRALVLHAKWYEGEGMELGPLGNALEVLRPSLTASVAARVFRDGSIATVETAIEALQIASRRYPVVLILDDLHYLTGSRELDRFIGALEEITLMVIATMRPSDNPALRGLRAALTGSIPPLDLEIGPLDGAAIAEAAEALFGVATPAPMLEQIAALSGGIPLTLREVLRELMAAGHVVSVDDETAQWRTAALDDAELRAIGDRVHGFSGRLDALPAEERQLLALAAFLGEQFNRDLLRGLAERLFTWDSLAFERLIVGGMIALATPTSRLGTRELEPRTCFAFVHTLLWKATGATLSRMLPRRPDLARVTLDLLVGGTGELYTTASLEGLEAHALDDALLVRLFDWLVAVDRRLAQIYSESFVALCQTTLEPARSLGRGAGASYLAALTAYGNRLYLTGADAELRGVAAEIASLLGAAKPPVDADERIARLEAALVVWHDAVRSGSPGDAHALVEPLLVGLPAPAEQSDRELRAAAEAIRLVASQSFARGDFASMLDVAAPYIPEMDRMRPEALNALLKVLLYAAMQAGREDEAAAMTRAALRLRREADLFTEYELLRHITSHALHTSDIDAARTHATAMRELVDRYPAYRNLSSNYFYLPEIAARQGRIAELAKLEEEFRAHPPPARTSREQIAIAQLKFVREWNQLGQCDRALGFASDLRRIMAELSPIMRVSVVLEELRARIDQGDRGSADLLLGELESISTSIGPSRGDGTSQRVRVHDCARMLAEALDGGAPLETLRRAGSDGRFSDHLGDAFRAARILLKGAEESPKGKRELSDAAYAILDTTVASAVAQGSAGMAHVWLDTMAPLLPKTRLQRFRAAAGESAHESAQTAEDAITGARDPGDEPILRTFGTLRIEGSGEGSAKIESKTRTLVAVLVAARMGDSRWIGELTRDHLADLLWPDMSLDRAVNNLHATLSYARRFLGGADTITNIDGVYDLGAELRIDAVEFRDCIQRGNRLFAEGIYFGAANAYRSGIALASGDFLEGMYADWIDSAREALRTELATALERLIGIEIERENYQAVPELADRLLTIDDLHDGAYEALIRSAAARGARREAFSLFKRYEDALEEYGAGPARRITTLMDRVRAGEA